MREKNSAIAKQLVSVEEKLNELRTKYGSMFKGSLDKPDIAEGGTPELSALQHAMYVQTCLLLNCIKKFIAKRKLMTGAGTTQN